MSFYLSIILGVALRLIPHPANFMPIGALAIYQSKSRGFVKTVIFVLITLLISDFFLGFHFAQPFVYLGFIAYALWGLLAKTKLGIVISAIGGSASFFIISNFGVWLGPWYSHDLDGFIKCFINAIPFYQNTLISDVLFTIVIFVLATGYKKIKEGEISWPKSLLQPIFKKK